MSTEFATEIRSETRRRTEVRARVLSALGPATVAAAIAWALLQPYRLTLMHPHGQGFWWLVVEPPLLVALAGLLFHFAVVPGLLEDLESER